MRINHEKFLILFRNSELVAWAEKRLGKTTAAVYEQLLRCFEDKLHQCRDTTDDVVEGAQPLKSK